MATLVQQTPLAETQTQPKSFLVNVGTVLGGQAANIAVALLLEICYARLLGPGPRGQISLCLMAIAFGSMLGGLGADTLVTIWMADRKRSVSEWAFAVIAWATAGTALFLLLWWRAYHWWSPSFLRGVTPELFRMVLISAPCAVVFVFGVAVLTGAERFRERAALSLTVSASGLCGFLLLTLFLGRMAESAVWGNFAGILVGIAVAGFLVKDRLAERWGKPSGDAPILGGLLKGLRGQAGNVAAFFNYRLDVFLVNYFLDQSHVGLYALGVVISESLWQIPQAAAVALFPRTARTVEDGATEFTCQTMRHVLLISLATGAALALASPLAVPLIFGARFGESVAVIWWILPGTIAHALTKIAASDLAGRYKFGYGSVFGLIALALTVALDVLLIPRWGIRGAAVASSAAYLTNAVLMLTALRHETQVTWRQLLVPRVEDWSRYQQAGRNVAARLGLLGPSGI